MSSVCFYYYCAINFVKLCCRLLHSCIYQTYYLGTGTTYLVSLVLWKPLNQLEVTFRTGSGIKRSRDLFIKCNRQTPNLYSESLLWLFTSCYGLVFIILDWPSFQRPTKVLSIDVVKVHQLQFFFVSFLFHYIIILSVGII